MDLERDALAFHVTMRLSDDRHVAPTVEALRRASWVIDGVAARRGLLIYRVVDTHLHALVAAPRDEVGRVARAVESGLRQALAIPVPFEAARVRPVRDPRHLGNAVRYVLTQEQRHGVRLDPLHEGSNLCDLLGLRLLPGGSVCRARLMRLLPRLCSADLRRFLGVEGDPHVTLALPELAASACAALAIPSLLGRSDLATLARHAAVHAAADVAEASAAQLAGALFLTERSVHRLRSCPPDRALLHAVRGQLLLRSSLRRGLRAAERTPTPFTEEVFALREEWAAP